MRTKLSRAPDPVSNPLKRTYNLAQNKYSQFDECANKKACHHGLDSGRVNLGLVDATSLGGASHQFAAAMANVTTSS